MLTKKFNRKPIQAVLAGFLSLVLLAACGGTATTLTPEPTNLPSTLKVCSYLSNTDVQPLLDAPIVNDIPNIKVFDVQVTPNGTCTYQAGLESVVVVIARPGSANGSNDWKVAESTFFASAAYNATTTTVDNLGDAALWSEASNGKGGGGYVVAKYPYLVAVLIAGKLPASPETYGVKLLNLTKLLLGKL